MRSEKLSEERIVEVLNIVKSGAPLLEVCGNYGISRSCFYRWRCKYGDMNLSQVKYMKTLETENARLKRKCSGFRIQNEIIKKAILKKELNGLYA